KNVNKTAAIMDLDKLDWINNQYLKNEDPQRLTDQVIPSLIEKKLIDKDSFDRDYILSIVKLFQARLTVLSEFVDWADFFFLKDIPMDPKAEAKYLARDLSGEFKLFIDKLNNLDKFDIVNIEDAFRKLVAELNIESKALIHPIRVALTGKTVGPGLFEVIYHLGRERTSERLKRWIK
ncbi:MAG: glutamate--tRNA ligase, partial [Candidatus Omnitrophica bacterium]|nr:glutamate--tRNA ligase [Candidatus Omnitrophota bacterium]